MIAGFIAAQRTDFGVFHAVACRALGVASSTFYKWRVRPPAPAQRRRAALDERVKACFDASAGTYGSPRVRARLRRDGLAVSKKTVESSMVRQGLQGRSPRRRRRALTRPDKAAAAVSDLLRRDFTAQGPDHKWVGDFKQIDTDEGPVFLATVEDLYSRRMLGYAMGDRIDTRLVQDALDMAANSRGGRAAGIVFHSDRGSQAGFKWSSQHLDDGGVGDGDDERAAAGGSAVSGSGAVASVGSRGDSYDNALAETIIGLYKTELVRHRGPWRGLGDLELATLEWTDWFNNRRIHHHNPGRIPPAEAEELHYRQQHSAHRAGTQTKQPA